MRAVETSTDRVGAPLALFGAIHRAAVRAEWAAAQATGLDIRVVADGEILLGAAPDFASTMFNRALGFAEAADRVGEAVAFFAEQGVQGEIVLDPADIPPGVTPRLRLEAYLADPAAIPAAPVPGSAIRVIEAGEAATWMDVVVEGYAPAPEVAAIWRSISDRATGDGQCRLLGELDGRLVAASSIFITGDRGWLSWATVLPAARGLGMQRAMIAARARVAADAGCTAIAAWALASAHSSRNLARAGMPLVGERVSLIAADLA
jgi:GNAT superfamily N-acetyltransferase